MATQVYYLHYSEWQPRCITYITVDGNPGVLLTLQWMATQVYYLHYSEWQPRSITYITVSGNPGVLLTLQ